MTSTSESLNSNQDSLQNREKKFTETMSIDYDFRSNLKKIKRVWAPEYIIDTFGLL